MSENLNKKVVSATKWSTVTEIAAKLVTPISTMVLARLLTPEAFGVLVTVTMVISFTEIFTDAGFQKYIIQHAFKDKESLYRSTAVAFWTNLALSIFLWAIIALFSSEIAHLVGNDGYGLVIAVACVCIPLEAFSSIQMALFKRGMDFRTLFLVRMVGVLIPLVITIPLAYITRSYWSLVIGMIALNVSNAVLLTWKSEWKPRWFYDTHLFREMFSFTMWSMIEAVSIWLTGYLDVFIVGTMLNTYYMGIYRTSIATVNSIMGIVTSATTPVLFSALSRLQNDDQEFKHLFFKFQKIVGLLIIPLGVGIFLFRDLVTEIILGSQWHEAAYFIGWWGLTSSITIVLSHYCSEIYRSKGKPKYSVLSQVLHLMFLIPTVIISVHYSFQILCLSRSLVRLTLVLINLILVFFLVKITPLDMFRNILHSCIASLAMCVVCCVMPDTDSILLQVIYVFVCAITYALAIMPFKEERNILLNLKKIIVKRQVS